MIKEIFPTIEAVMDLEPEELALFVLQDLQQTDKGK